MHGSDLLIELHQAVWLLLKEPDSEQRLDKLAEIHAKVTRYLLNAGFTVDEQERRTAEEFAAMQRVEIDRDTFLLLNRLFQAGVETANQDKSRTGNTPCPYEDADYRTWWLRGYHSQG